MLRRNVYIILSIILMILSVACTKDINNTPNGDEGNINSELEDDEEKITLYFANKEVTDLVREEIVTNLGTKTLEEVIIEELKNGPLSKDLRRTVPKNIDILDVQVEDDVAKVNVSSNNLGGSSTEEVFFIASVVKSLTDIDYINKVQFYIDGKKAESLMGHISIEKPFTKESADSLINPNINF